MAALLGDVVERVRSKNAGPFWITIDIFCGDAQRYNAVVEGLSNKAVASTLQLAPKNISRYELADLHAIKISFPRPIVQGSAGDRDMHGAQYAVLVSGLALSTD